MSSSSANLALRCAIRLTARDCGRCLQKSMQARAFEKPAALPRLDAQLHGVAVENDSQTDLLTGLAVRPDAAEETGEVAYVLAGDRDHDVAGAQVGLLRRSAIGETDNDQAIL